MIKQISAATLSICIGACASSGPEAPAPAAMASSQTANSVASDKPTPQSGDEIHELAATEAPEVASASSENESDKKVCRREKLPGSNFFRKICETQAVIDARAEQDKNTVRQMRRSGTYVSKDSGGG